jgi:hypothetical protein
MKTGYYSQCLVNVLVLAYGTVAYCAWVDIELAYKTICIYS